MPDTMAQIDQALALANADNRVILVVEKVPTPSAFIHLVIAYLLGLIFGSLGALALFNLHIYITHH